MEEKIYLNKVIGENILTRNSIASLFERKINRSKKEEIIIDFKNVKFMSRSGAAEYLKLREESDKRIIERNMSDEIKSMFSLVEKQFKKVKFIFTKETPTEIVNISS